MKLHAGWGFVAGVVWCAAGMLTVLTAAGDDRAKSQAAMTPQQAFERLQEGHARFLAGEAAVRDVRAEMQTAAGGQYPFATIITCLDSRLGAERLFDQGIGDVFCGRTAGNYVDPAMLGGLEFTNAVAGSKLIVVLGHTQCGAVKAACNHATGGNLDALVANLRPAVRAVSGEADPDVRRGGDAKFVQRVAEAHVRLTVSGLGERSETLKRLLETGRIGVAGGIYDLATGKIAWLADAAVNVKPAAAAPAAAAE